MTQHCAGPAPLDQQLLPAGPLEEEGVVLGEGGSGPQGTGGGVLGHDRVLPVPGRNLRIRKRMAATGRPAWSVKLRRVVMKWPTPRAVFFSGETDSMEEEALNRSPRTTGRRYCCSQSVATTEVKPPSSRTCMSSSAGVAPSDRRPAARASANSAVAL